MENNKEKNEELEFNNKNEEQNILDNSNDLNGSNKGKDIVEKIEKEEEFEMSSPIQDTQRKINIGITQKEVQNFSQPTQNSQSVEKNKEKEKLPKGTKIVIVICVVWTILLFMGTILGFVFIPKLAKKINKVDIIDKNEIVENIIGDKIENKKDKEIKENIVIGKTEVFDNYNSSMNDVSTIVENVMPSMVSITTKATVEYINPFFGGYVGEYEAEGAGSGIIISQTEEYLSILTNEHVVSGASEVQIGFIDNENVEGVIKSSDYNADLAIIIVEIDKIPLTTLESIKVATLGDSNELKLGQNVVAIGNSLGYGQTVTSGIVSALNREVTSDDGIRRTFIQTDAAINPGNSGGALLNMNGEVIGINESKISSSEIEGVGFAIPVSNATEIIEKLSNREYRKVVEETNRGYLGISCIDVDTTVSQTYNMPTGVFIYDVAPNSSAEKSGLKKGDIITKFDGVDISTTKSLVDLVSRYEVGEKVNVVLYRAESGEYIEQTIEVELLSQQYEINE